MNGLYAFAHPLDFADADQLQPSRWTPDLARPGPSQLLSTAWQIQSEYCKCCRDYIPVLIPLTLLMQVNCKPPGGIQIRLIEYRPTLGGYLKLAVLNVAGSGGLTAVGVKSASDVSQYPPFSLAAFTM